MVCIQGDNEIVRFYDRIVSKLQAFEIDFRRVNTTVTCLKKTVIQYPIWGANQNLNEDLAPGYHLSKHLIDESAFIFALI